MERSLVLPGAREPNPVALIRVNYPFRKCDVNLSHSPSSTIIIDNILSKKHYQGCKELLTCFISLLLAYPAPRAPTLDRALATDVEVGRSSVGRNRQRTKEEPPAPQ
jgi:hypothetical protein